MKVFISWSKPVAQQVAQILRDWIPLVINQVRPWMSKADIEAGVRWGPQLATELEGTDFGIVCLTPENLDEPWIYFESGALSKQVSLPSSRLIPLLFRVSLTDIRRPLQQFQAVTADKDGLLGIILSLHKALQPALIDDATVRRAFDKWWPDLEAGLGSIAVPDEKQTPTVFNQEEAIREILLTMRESSRNEVYSPHRIETITSNSALGDPDDFGVGLGSKIIRFRGNYGKVAKFIAAFTHSRGLNIYDIHDLKHEVFTEALSSELRKHFSGSGDLAEAISSVIDALRMDDNSWKT